MKDFLGKYFLLMLICLMFNPALFSQNKGRGFEKYREMSLEDLINLEVITATSMEQKLLETPSTIEVITSEDIKNRGYSNLEEILHDLPGFNFSKANGITLSTIYQRGYRANNTDRTILMIDGVEENDIWKGVAWLDKQYPISNIKRIEVVYGPASALYGANAFQGIINIITKDADDFDKTFNLSTYYGSYNTFITEANFSKRIKDFELSLTYRRYYSEEMDLSAYPEWDYKKPADADFIFPIDKYENNKNDYSIHFKMKNGDFKFGGLYWQRNDGSGATYVDLYKKADDKYYSDVTLTWNIRNMHYYASYETEIAKNLTSQSKIIFQRHEHIYDSNDQYIIDDDKNNVVFTYRHELSKRSIIEQRLKYKAKLFGQDHSFILGFQYKDAFIQGDYIKNDYIHTPGDPYPEKPETVTQDLYDTKDYGLFFQDIFKPIENLSITLGARYDYKRIRHSAGFGGVFNPRVGLVYLINPKLSVKLLYGRGYSSVPNWTLFSTTDTRMANPTLEPEIVNSKEICVGYKFSDKLFVESAFYHNSYKDKAVLITYPQGVLDPQNPQITDRNEAVGNWTIYGFELKAKYVLNNFSAFANFSYSHPFDEDEDLEIGNIGETLNFGFNYGITKKINFNLRGNWAGERNSILRNSEGDFLYKVDSYFVCNSSLQFRDYLIEDSELAFIVNNIFDTEYFDPGVRTGAGKYGSKLPQNDRNILLKLTLGL